MHKVVINISSYINEVSNLKVKSKGAQFFRGTPKNYKDNSVPGIYRLNELYNEVDIENDLVYELLRHNPMDFAKAENCFEKLTIMQHYGLPTRLLDVTENMLVALYFACLGDENEEGIVSIYEVENNNIKNFNNNGVHILSSLAFINKFKKNDCDIEKRIANFFKKEGNNEINVKKEDYDKKVILVKPKLNNPRIRAQQGAFLLFGINLDSKNFKLKISEKETQYITTEEITIEPKHKQEILKELSRCGINQKTLFPEIDSVAKFLVDKYKNN